MLSVECDDAANDDVNDDVLDVLDDAERPRLLDDDALDVVLVDPVDVPVCLSEFDEAERH